MSRLDATTRNNICMIMINKTYHITDGHNCYNSKNTQQYNDTDINTVIASNGITFTEITEHSKIQ